MLFLTDFADQAVVLPVWLCMTCGLWLAGWRRGAMAFGLAVVAVLSAMVVSKLIAGGCGVLVPWAHLNSPSGHTAAGTCIYGGAVALLLRRRLGVVSAVLLAGLPVAVTIGLSRLDLEVHTAPEVFAGAAVGLAGLGGLVAFAGVPPSTLLVWPVVAVAAIVIAALHGVRLPAEPQLQWAAVHVWPMSLCRGGNLAEVNVPFAVRGNAP